jgi:hypothetical protein
MRKIIIVSLALILVLSFGFQMLVNKPTSNFDRQPAGWSSSLAKKDLAGNLAAFHEAAAPVLLSANDYARITAYASVGYMEALYVNGGTVEDGSAAFFTVVRLLMPDETFHSRLPKTEDSEIAARALVRLKGKLEGDGYDNNYPPKPVKHSSPLDLGPDKSLYTWSPPMGNGPELERTWGEIEPFYSFDCTVPPPPVRDINELKSAAQRVSASMNAMEQHPNGDGLTTLAYAYAGGYTLRSEPVRIWLQIIANAAVDAEFSQNDSDTLLATAAMAFHDTMIKTWKGKFTHLLAHPLAVDRDNFPLVNATAPSYPSEQTAIAQAGADLLEHFVPGTKPRIELPGSVISSPTTRVLNNGEEAVREFGALSQMLGLAYDFDLKAGSDLGSCVADYIIAERDR